MIVIVVFVIIIIIVVGVVIIIVRYGCDYWGVKVGFVLDMMFVVVDRGRDLDWGDWINVLSIGWIGWLKVVLRVDIKNLCWLEWGRNGFCCDKKIMCCERKRCWCCLVKRKWCVKKIGGKEM